MSWPVTQAGVRRAGLGGARLQVVAGHVTAEFDPAQLPRAPRDVLAQVVSQLAAEGGMSTRAIGDALGISQSTAARLSRSGESPDSPGRPEDRDRRWKSYPYASAPVGTPAETRASAAKLGKIISSVRTGTRSRPPGPSTSKSRSTPKPAWSTSYGTRTARRAPVSQTTAR